MAKYKKPKVKLKINPFDVNSIDLLISDLTGYQKNLENRVGEVLDKMAEKGVEIAKEKLIMYGGVDTQELLDSIHAEKRSNTLSCIIADTDHAIFVEFGTGQMGEEMPYPYQFPEGVTWIYNESDTIFQISDGMYGWFYPADDGTWKFTMGMESRPFMYETAMDLPLYIRKLAKEVFNDA